MIKQTVLLIEEFCGTTKFHIISTFLMFLKMFINADVCPDTYHVDISVFINTLANLFQ